MKIIDVSKWNDVIQWHLIPQQCDGAIIRVGYRGYAGGSLVVDKKAKENLNGATNNHLPIGVYFTTQAINEKEAIEEALFTIQIIAEYKITLPVFIDSEDANEGKGRADHRQITQYNRTKIINAFCEEIEKAGYKAGVYASASWFKTCLDYTQLTKYYLWVAKYSKTKPSIPYNAWQYTSKGRIIGIRGDVDISTFDPVETTKSYNDVADEVLKGLWGNADDRIRNLEAAGYNYNEIQKLVNAKFKSNAQFYTVKKGDTLGKIARAYGTTTKKLAEFNNIKDPDVIQIGQNIRVR